MIDSATQVITGFNHYDYGLPGSGILIWHIKEPEEVLYSQGINNNKYDKYVQIEEADGSIDIGFESYALFSNNNPTNGTKWDFWFMNNDAYYYTNDNAEICLNSQNYEVLEQYSSQYQCEQNGGEWVKPIIFDKYSNPNSDLNDRIQSFFSFELLDSISQDIKRVKVKYESLLDYTDYNFLLDYSIIGTAPESIFYKNGVDVYSFNLSDASLELREDLLGAEIVLTDSNNQSYSSDANCYFSEGDVNQETCDDCELRLGYFYENYNIDAIHLCSSDNDYSFLSITGNNVSIGDIDFDGLDEIVWVSDGKIIAANYARRYKIPFLGICLGLQISIIEIMQNVIGYKDAGSSEFGEFKNPVVGLLKEWDNKGKKEIRSIKDNKGGTMRLGAYECIINKNSKAFEIYKNKIVWERHRHRYEVNINYEQTLKESGIIFSGKSPNGLLPEILEIKNHPWFIGVQFHPELKSSPLIPHPIFASFIKAAIKQSRLV